MTERHRPGPFRRQDAYPAAARLLRGHRSVGRRLSRQLSALHGARPHRIFPLRRGHRLADLDEPEPIAWTCARRRSNSSARAGSTIRWKSTHVCAAHHRRAHDAGQKIYAGATLLSEGVEACIITLTGKPRRIPQEIRDKLAPFLSKQILNTAAPKFGHV